MEISILNKDKKTFLETYNFLINIIQQIKNLNNSVPSHFQNREIPMFWIVPDKEYTKKQTKLFNFRFNIFFNINHKEKVKEIMKQVVEFFNLDERTAQRIHSITSVTDGRRGSVATVAEYSFETKTDTYYDKDFLLLLDTTETLNMDNISFLVNNFKTSCPSDIKEIRESLFGTLNGKVWNKALSEYEATGKIVVKRTPKGLVREIILNNANLNSDNLNIMLKLESQGKLKQISSSWDGTTNNKYAYELYKFNLFPHLKTTLLLIDDTFHIKVEYFVMKYGKNIMQDMGVWQDFKHALNFKLEKKISSIEEFLNIEITNKLTPLKYLENTTGESSFLSKPFIISIRD
jgi:hypothetical protein